MPRDLILSNGSLLINFDLDYAIRDIYYPWIGLENHSLGCKSRTGVWVSGQFAWLDGPNWEKRHEYESDTLVTAVSATNRDLKLTLNFHDTIDLGRNIFLRQVDIVNLDRISREVRLFFHYDFRIGGNDIGGTIYYHPVLKAMIAFKGQRYFLASGKAGTRLGVEHWTSGTKGPQGTDGCWRDAEDGVLDRVPVSYGSVDGMIAMRRQAIPPKGTASMFHWLVVGSRFREIENLDNMIKQRGPELFINRTRDYWRAWTRKEKLDCDGLPQSIRDLYYRSLLVIRTQIDNGGAILASVDSDIVSFWRDTYAYAWGRDGAFVAEALDLAGYPEPSRRFFEFCGRVITSEGYLLQKYAPDGSLASSWIPWSDQEGNLQLPIQEDETGLVLHALWKHFEKYRDLEFISPLYSPLIQDAGSFLMRYREPVTGLPAPSYDLWEERRAIHLFTVAAVWAGLVAAGNFTELMGDHELCRSLRSAADEIRTATVKYFYDQETGRFVRSLEVQDNGTIIREHCMDSSIAGVFLLGMFPANDPIVERSMNFVRENLWCDSPIGGIVRYENDSYCKANASGDTTGDGELCEFSNPWFVCTMWLALYYIERAETVADLEPALELLNWAQARALPSGILAEQVHPLTGAPLNVSPLTWSHASVVTAIIRYTQKYRRLSDQPEYNEK